MSSVETFEATLKEVVQAKRLSQSKMTKLTENALKCMDHDTQLVSVLYRTHKTLSPAQKISSLYTFDALARAAKHQVTKHNVSADAASEKGNCATFLLKVEGVLDGLFQDMLSLDHPDAKEKSKKIVDIWVKSNTFPSAVLARLSKLVKDAFDQDSNKVTPATPVTADPRQQHRTPPVTVPSPPQAPVTSNITPPATTPTADVQSTLLALLSQAATAVNGQTTANTAAPVNIPPPQLNAGQLALFQQLTAKAGNVVPTHPYPVPISSVPPAHANAIPPVAPPIGGPSQPYRDNQSGYPRSDSRYDRYGGPERTRDRDDYYDDRRGPRGDFRGRNRGGFRGRGRGRWDDRPNSDRNNDREWNSPTRSRHSRSRSPTRNTYAARRDIRPYSPPGRPSMAASPTAPPINTSGSGKDEFGRDIRSDSSRQATPQSTTTHTPPTGEASSVLSVDDTPRNPIGTDAQAQPNKEKPGEGGVSTTSDVSPASSSEIGLDMFDYSSFNPTDAASWAALGKAWAVTNGYMPSEMELMQYVMAGGMAMLPVASQFGMEQGTQWSGQDNQSWNHPNSNANRGRGRGRGRGGYGNGNGRGQWGHSGSAGTAGQETDAITLGGGDSEGGYEEYGEDGHYQQHDDSQRNGSHGQDPISPTVTDQDTMNKNEAGTGGGAGRMQRVGDKWVFVRGETVPAQVS